MKYKVINFLRVKCSYMKLKCRSLSVVMALILSLCTVHLFVQIFNQRFVWLTHVNSLELSDCHINQ